MEIDLFINKNVNTSEVVRTTIQDVIEFFSIDKRKMGDPLFLGDLFREIGNVEGVVNVIDIRVFNKVGGQYSMYEVSQPYKDEVTKEIQQNDMSIYMKSNQIFQIRYPNIDIKVRTKTVGVTY